MSWLGGTWLLLPALALDAGLGDPHWLWRRVPHPVALVGRLVDALDRRLNRERDPPGTRRAKGVLAAVVIVAVAAGAGQALRLLAAALPAGWIIELCAIAILLGQRSLYEHVAAVADALQRDGIAAARAAVAHVVGRDTARLDEAGVSRAAIESLAEGFCDAVVAPLLWYVVAGLPGMLVYKAVNTADSMIGHRSPRHEQFGWASARADDLLNLPAARLAALVLVAVTPLARGTAGAARALRAVWSDAPRHRSPNAGWPEAAMAGALDLALAGPREYAGETIDDAWMHPAGRRDARADDIRAGLSLYAAACALLFLLAVPVAFGLA
ncbi:MAG: adenosylcobinamide-phosphate synthase CbiB [Gammaproteobacteria bacterium]|nr:adenosylcobinamide-phosphate synthase CbiB [Gammaproteobacteria bacterium]